MMRAHNVSFSYGAERVLRGISAVIQKGCYTSLVGPNGSGKTTLLSILSGFMRPGAGEVTLEGRNLFRIPFRERATQIAVIQQGERMAMPFTCLEAVLMGLTPHLPRLCGPTAQELSFVRGIMEQTDTAFLMDKPVTRISGGELQRVLIARALAQKPRMLFLDEAMSDLDVSARLMVLKLLKRSARREGLTVLAVHHDLSTAYGVSDEVLVLHRGSLRAQGAPETVLTPGLFAEIFDVEAEIVPGKGPFFRDVMDKSI